VKEATMDAATFEIIDKQARDSAAEMLGAGWDGACQYDLGTYIGDLQALEERIGRKATRDERIELERMIREYLEML
jgi:hypothetical protein